MPTTTNDDRHARKERVYRHIRNVGGEIKNIEIAEALGIHERVLRDYLNELADENLIYKDGWYWYLNPDPPKTLSRPDLKAEEAMAIYLALRLFVKQSDKRNFDVENALDKLAAILSKDANLGADIADAAEQLRNRPVQDGYEDIFRTITRSYLYRHPVRIIYHPYRGESFETRLCPYLLEPSAIGFSTYAIGHSSIVGKLRTYKIERILKAEIVHSEHYEIPADFPGLSLLKNAWSIFYGEATVAVTLRFHPDVARRVRETYWHPSQENVIDDPQNEGFVLLRFEVADTTDLKPWIRTWGANCEVLEPQDLRDEMMGEARRFAELYGWSTHRGGYQGDEDDPYGLNNTLSDYFG